jgi:hypothetical protein
MARRSTRRLTRRQYGSGGSYPVFRGSRQQRGGSFYPVFTGIRHQRGAGLGGMFRSLFRTVSPHLKKGLTHLGKRALTAGANALTDMSENKTSFKDALKKQAKNELKALNPINMLRSMDETDNPPRKRKRSSALSSSSKKLKPSKKQKKRNSAITL